MLTQRLAAACGWRRSRCRPCRRRSARTRCDAAIIAGVDRRRARAAVHAPLLPHRSASWSSLGVLVVRRAAVRRSSRCSRETSGLALSLAGVAGIIVSVGVTVDSYVVFFERLKDEVRSGRTMRNSAQRGFAGAWHTILVADLVSLHRRRRAVVPHGRLRPELRLLPRAVDADRPRRSPTRSPVRWCCCWLAPTGWRSAR